MMIIFQFFRMCLYLPVFQSGEIFVRIMIRSLPAIGAFAPFYMLGMLAFSWAGHVLYGVDMDDWSTLGSAFFRVYEGNYNLYNTDQMYEHGRVSTLYTYCKSLVLRSLFLRA